MRITSIHYFFKEAFKSLIKNSLMTVASIITVASCIFILLISYNIGSNIDYMLQNFQKTMGFSVFINNSVSNDTVTTLYESISKLNNVKSIKYISSKEAYDLFKISLKDKSAILDAIPPEQFPRSFDIFLEDNTKTADTVSELEKDVGDDKFYSSVKYAQEQTNFMISLSNIIRIIGVILILGLGIISTIIITNTIKIAVSNRKTEINIMKYVGATDWFIRWPFVIEGIMIGLLGAIIPILLTYGTYNKSIEYIKSHIGFASSILQCKPAMELAKFSVPLAIGIGVLIGVLGSVTSIHKHLHV